MTNLHVVSRNQSSLAIQANKALFDSLDKIVIHLSDCIKIISTNKIEFIQASGSYCIIHMTDGSKLMTCKTLKSVSRSLDHSFIRTHKSFVINLKYISEYFTRSGEITMASSKRVLVSRANKSMIRDIFS